MKHIATNDRVIFTGDDHFESKNYWLQQVKALSSYEKHFSFTGNPGGDGIKRYSYTFEKNTAGKLLSFCRHNDLSVYIFILSAYSVLIQKFFNAGQVIFASPLFSKKQHGIPAGTGMFLPIICTPGQELSFRELLIQSRKTVQEIIVNQHYPVEMVYDELGINPEKNIFDAAIVCSALHGQYTENAQVPLVIKLEITGNDIILDMRFSGSFPFSPDDFLMRFNHLTGSCLHALNAPLKNISMLLPGEQDRLLGYGSAIGFGPAASPFSFIRQLEHRFGSCEGDAAITCNGRTCTYGELMHLSRALALGLRQQHGLRKGDRVAVLLERNEWMVITLVSLLTNGLVYVPIDNSYPQQRIHFLLQDVQPSLVIADGPLQEMVRHQGFQAVTPASLLGGGADGGALPPSAIGSEDTAYIIYTSGSTGHPKGVRVSHGNLNHFLGHVCRRHVGSAGLTMPFVASHAFDISLFQVLTPLLSGGCCVVVAKEGLQDMEVFAGVLGGVTAIDTVPAVYQGLCNHLQGQGMQGLVGHIRRVFIGGDRISDGLLRQVGEVFSGAVVVVTYGPTEGTIFCTEREYGPGEIGEGAKGSMIGRAIVGSRVYVMNGELQLVGEGMEGEICIGGGGVAQGYYGREELSGERFVGDGNVEGGRMYRSGDLGRWRGEGVLEFRGRLDDQVKIRGYRIEPAEIEHALLQSNMVSAAVVVCRSAASEGSQQLVAYVVAAEGFHKDALLAYLQRSLPHYMVPSLVVQLERIPLTPNGKTDRKALPDPEGAGLAGQGYVAPRNDAEQQLAALWQQLLGIERIGIHDNFFELGGHSLLATRLVSIVKKQVGVALTIKEVFTHPTISGLSGCMQSKENAVLVPPVTAGPYPARIPLSFGQERLWFIDRLSGSVQYHMPLIITLQGSLDEQALHTALQTIVNRHEILRTVIGQQQGEAYQTILTEGLWRLHFLDAYDCHNNSQRLQQVAEPIVSHPFDLSADHMLRAHLLRLSPTRNLLILTLHHIACDGWSMPVIGSELARLYRALVQGQPAELPPLAVQYADYALWQRRYLSDALLAEKLGYWQRKLHGVSPLNLPTDYVRPVVQSTRGSLVHALVEEPLTQALQQLSAREGVTLFMTLLAAFKVLLHRYSAQRDICVGVPIAGRQQWALEGLVGFFVNTLALRSEVTGGESFVELLSAVRQTTLGGYDHQEVPFEKVVDAVAAARDMSRSPLFQVVFVLQNMATGKLEAELPGLVLSKEHTIHLTSKFDLSFSISQTEDGLSVEIEYCTALYRQDTVERMAGHYSRLLEAIAADPGCTTGALPMLSAAEEQQLTTGFNQTAAAYPTDKTIIDLFREQVLKHPQATAVVFEQQSLTYTALDVRSNQLGHYLRGKGVKAESLVAVCLERGVDLMVAIMGILKAGGAYVPVDPAYPDERIAYMLQDSAVALVVSSSGLSERLGTLTKAVVVALDAGAHQISLEREDAPGAMLLPSNLAYVIYTSGSTGKPKGVMVEHVNVVRLFKTDAPLFDFDASDKWSMFHSVCFDFSVWEMYGALFHGGCMVIVSNEVARDTQLFAGLLAAEGITVVSQTPSAFYVLQEHMCAKKLPLSVRYVVFGGEALNPGKLKPWDNLYKDCALINMYGITETTVHVSYQKIAEAQINGSSSIIGKPIPTLTAHILNRERALVPVGVAGELYIGGAGLARGYLNLPALTAERFVYASLPNLPVKRFYKTGDMARWLADGTIEYLGRMDDQVKIRGHRIEPGEIEAVLQQSEWVSDCVVAIKPDHAGNNQLVGYVVAKNTFDLEKVRAYLKRKLPEYMVPALLVQLDKIPVTVNGKVDKKALPDPDARMLSDRAYVLPRTETERQIAAIWHEVLGVEKASIHDNFFHIGGDSIKVIRVLGRLQKLFGTELKVIDVYLSATIYQLAVLIGDHPGKKRYPDEAYDKVTAEVSGLREAILPYRNDKDEIADIYPMSDIQLGMLYDALREPSLAIYHDQMVYRLRKKLDRLVFEKALALMVDKHEILRTAFNLDEYAEGVQVLYKSIAVNVDYRDLRPAGIDPVRFIRDFLEQERKTPFQPGKPMWRAAVFDLEEESVFIFQCHHAILDGWSVASFNTELNNTYLRLLLDAGENRLAPLHCTHKQYIIDSILHKRAGTQAAFWKNELADYKRLDLFLPEAVYLRQVKSYGKTYLEALEEKTKQDNISLKCFFFGAYLYVLSMLSYEQDLVAGLVTNTRPEMEDGDKLLGCFLNTVPFRISMQPALSWTAYFLEIENRLTELKKRDHYSLADIAKIAGVKPAGQNPFFDTIFNFLNFHIYQDLQADEPGPARVAANDEKTSSGDSLDFAISNTFLDCDAIVTGENFSIRYSLSRKFRSARSLNDLMEWFDTIIKLYLKDSHQKISRESILSPQEQQLLTGFNQTAASYPKDKTIIDLFGEQVLKHPQATAVVFEQQSLTYAALDARSNQLGHYLRGKGVKAESLVAVCLERGVDMIVAILGILKAGGAYVPVDPAYPDERIAYMLQDSAAALVVSSGGLSERLGALTKAVVVALDAGAHQISLEREDAPGAVLSPSNLAYVIYTSGSTGKPKGVMIEHNSLVNFVTAMVKELEFGCTSSMLSVTTFSFDIFNLELYLPLLYGGKMILVSTGVARDGFRLKEAIAYHQPSHIQATPSGWQLLLSANWTNQENIRILAGGEALDEACKVALTQRGPVWNLYGPTETTIWSSVKKLGKAEKISIGKPINNTVFYILDKLGNLSPVGVAGEMYIGGEGLARGYLHQPELTAARFVNLPAGGNAILRLYKTGDAGCWLPDGNIAFLGRLDDQVKIRGYRIEPAEIEHALLQSNMVSAAVVVCRSAASEGSQQLVAYVVAAEGFHKDALLAYLQRSLPHYMVPSLVVQLERIPLTPNGKTDRKALPYPEGAGLAGQGYVAPRNDTEQQLAALWQQLLGIERIGIHDNFFELGGHSLLAMKAVAAMRRQPATAALSMRHIFEDPTIARLAVVAAGHGPARAVAPITGGGRPARVPLSFGQERLWFIDQLEGSVHYHLPFVLRLQGAVDARALEEAFQQVIKRQEVLRSVVREGETGVFQQLLEAEGWQLEVIDAQGGGKGVVEGWISELVSRPFNLGQDYMLRAQLLLAAGSERVLVVTMHHIASDGWSVPIVVKELLEAYVAAARGTLPGWKALPVQYSDYALWQRSYLQGEVLEGQLSYWKKQLEGVLALELPTDYVRPKVMDSRGGRVYFELEEPLRQGLEGLSGSHGATLYMTLLSAFKVLLYRYSGQEDICVGSASANRMQWEVQGVVGCFVNTLALRSRVEGKMGFEELLRQVRQTTVGAYAHQEVPFEKVVDAVVKQRQADRSPLFQVMFDLQQSVKVSSENNDFPFMDVSEEKPDHATAKFELSLTVVDSADRLTLSAEYSKALFSEATVYRLLQHYQELLKAVVKDPGQPVGRLCMLTAEEHILLTEGFNHTKSAKPADTGFITLFEAQVSAFPQNIAVVSGHEKVTYKALNEWANEIGHLLQEKGVKAESLVPVCMERSLALVASVIGIMKAGGAFVPVDPDYPTDRIAYMVEDTGAAVMLTTGSPDFGSGITGNIAMLDVSERNEKVPEAYRENISTTPDLHHLAYVMYTSGSTGRPKGVMIEHHSLINYLRNGKTGYVNGLSAHSGSFMHLAYTFDASLTAMLMPLLYGKPVVVGTGSSAEVFTDRLFYQHAPYDFIKLTPAHLALMKTGELQENIGAVTATLVVGGEALKPHHLRYFVDHRIDLEIINEYGPTEATVGCSTYCLRTLAMEENLSTIPIGKPINNVQMYIVNESMDLCAVGITGEICIGGEGLARGYLNLPHLTKEKFVPDPFSAPSGREGRLYKTGDLGRWLPDGNIVYTGRLDDQVKINGYRIELGEVEAVLLQSKLVTEGVVLVKESGSGIKSLVAFIVPAAGVEVAQIGSWLRNKLPGYMVPGLSLTDHIPLTVNGKTDKKALLEREAGDQTGIEYEAPSNDMEIALMVIWQELLGVEKIGIHDDFFQLGGHSLLATQVISSIRKKFLLKLPMQILFEYTTIQSLGRFIALELSAHAPAALQADEFDMIEI